MPNTDKWTLSNTTSQEPLGNDLNGLRIKKTASGYELYAVLARTDENQPPFTMSNVQYDDQTWDLTFTSLPNNGDPGSGSWTIPDPGPTGDPIDGDFQAQATGDEDDAEAASSAKA